MPQLQEDHRYLSINQCPTGMVPSRKNGMSPTLHCEAMALVASQAWPHRTKRFAASSYLQTTKSKDMGTLLRALVDRPSLLACLVNCPASLLLNHWEHLLERVSKQCSHHVIAQALKWRTEGDKPGKFPGDLPIDFLECRPAWNLGGNNIDWAFCS
jgi:hypothetical protein